MLLRAGESIQVAAELWNTENWPWLLRPIDLDVIAGSSSIELPWDFKDVYGGRLVTAKRPLFVVNRRMVNRFKPDQTQSGIPAAVDFFDKSYTGTLRLIDTPVSNDTLRLEYFRNMTIPCAVTIAGCSWTSSSQNITSTNPLVGVKLGAVVDSTRTPASAIVQSIVGQTVAVVSTASTNTGSSASVEFGSDTDFIDIPQQFENALLEEATAHFLATVGGPVEKAMTFKSNAAAMFNRAKKQFNPPADMDLAFLPPPADPYFWNPNATW